MKSAFSAKEVKKRVARGTATVKSAEKRFDQTVQRGHKATHDILDNCDTASELPVVRKKIAQATAGIKYTAQVLSRGIVVAHNVTGDILSRHEAGTAQVRKFMGWKR